MATMKEEVSHVDGEATEGLKVPVVTWYKHAGLRKLYLMMPLLFLGKSSKLHGGKVR
jgi:hypothetical protein